jgi:hypothetical protein
MGKVHTRARLWSSRAMGALIVLGAWALSLHAAFAPRTAHAQAAPLACAASSKLTLKYQQGLGAGQQKAEALYAAADVNKNPQKLRKKLGRVLERLYLHVRDAWEQDVGEGRRCRVQGVADGFLGRLSRILGECVLDGAQWGQFASTLYCELSVELGGLAVPSAFLRAPVGLCATLFEQVCDDSYAYVASEASDPLEPALRMFLEGRATTLQPYAGCLPFTEGDFAQTFSEAMAIDCAFGAP